MHLKNDPKTQKMFATSQDTNLHFRRIFKSVERETANILTI